MKIICDYIHPQDWTDLSEGWLYGEWETGGFDDHGTLQADDDVVSFDNPLAQVRRGTCLMIIISM